MSAVATERLVSLLPLNVEDPGARRLMLTTAEAAVDGSTEVVSASGIAKA